MACEVIDFYLDRFISPCPCQWLSVSVSTTSDKTLFIVLRRNDSTIIYMKNKL